MILNCLRCNKEVYIRFSRKDTFKYCSRDCKYKASVGKPTWNKGKKGSQIAWDKGLKGVQVAWNKGIKGIHLSPNTEFKKGQFVEENHPNWKGDKVGYFALHDWVYRHKGKPTKCEHCAEPRIKFQWANKSHKYIRNLDDWISLCIKCHRKHDGFSLKNRKRDKKGRLVSA